MLNQNRNGPLLKIYRSTFPEQGHYFSTLEIPLQASIHVLLIEATMKETFNTLHEGKNTVLCGDGISRMELNHLLDIATTTLQSI